MTELELYRFIQDSDSQTKYDGEEALIWVYHSEIDEFVKLIDEYLLGEGGLEVTLQESYIVIDMTQILKDNNIDPYSVFDSE